MNPIDRTPSPIFKTDEDIQHEFNKVYQAVKNTVLNYGSISRREITKLYAVDKETANIIMDLIKKEFKRKNKI
jgi:hypothetical protein